MAAAVFNYFAYSKELCILYSCTAQKSLVYTKTPKTCANGVTIIFFLCLLGVKNYSAKKVCVLLLAFV